MKKLFIILGISAVVFACNSGEGGNDAAADKTADTQTVAPGTSGIAHERGLELIGASDCTTCHEIDKKKTGPAYTDVAKKYEPTPAVIDTLISKIIHGGTGVWGTIPMTPHPTLSEADAREMVMYIMTLDGQ